MRGSSRDTVDAAFSFKISVRNCTSHFLLTLLRLVLSAELQVPHPSHQIKEELQEEREVRGWTGCAQIRPANNSIRIHLHSDAIEDVFLGVSTLHPSAMQAYSNRVLSRLKESESALCTGTVQVGLAEYLIHSYAHMRAYPHPYSYLHKLAPYAYN